MTINERNKHGVGCIWQSRDEGKKMKDKRNI